MDASTTAELMIRMIVGLAVVLGLLVVGTRVARGRVGRTTTVDIKICGRQVLSKASSIAVVRVGGRHLLLGVNDSSISLLAEGDDLVSSPVSTSPEPVLPAAPTPTPTADSPATIDGADVVDVRNSVIEALRQKTIRRN